MVWYVIIVQDTLVSLGVSSLSHCFPCMDTVSKLSYCLNLDFCFMSIIYVTNFLIFALNLSITGNESTTCFFFLVTWPAVCLMINSHLCIPQVPESLDPTMNLPAKADGVMSFTCLNNRGIGVIGKWEIGGLGQCMPSANGMLSYLTKHVCYTSIGRTHRGIGYRGHWEHWRIGELGIGGDLCHMPTKCILKYVLKCIE